MANYTSGKARKGGRQAVSPTIRLGNRIEIDPQTGCHIWTGCKKDKNSKYGAINVGGKRKSVHRVIWEATHGPIPAGLCVCHDCPGGDNPLCANIDHMFLDTIAGNNRDRHMKGRTHSKLDKKQVKEILCRIYFGDKDVHIASDYDVTRANIYFIRKGLTWRDLEG